MPFSRRKVTIGLASITASVLALTACSSADSSDGDKDSINVLMINSPQFEELQTLTEKYFTPDTGIKVNFTSLPENDLRDRVSQEFSAQAGEYDVASISAYDTPIFAANNWLASVEEQATSSEEYNLDDMFDSITSLLRGEDGELYAVPFFAEGSFLFYRTDVMDEAGIEIPERPTWDEVAEAARTIQDGEFEEDGICLRGLAGWGQNLAPFSTVVNTFGARWVDENWNPQLDSPEFEEALEFYADLLQDAGPQGSAQNGVLECINFAVEGSVAMMYDATSIAAQVEADDSPTQGDWGYAQAPVKETDNSGWLWTWAWGIQEASDAKDESWEFASWATSEEYQELVAEEFGWQKVPAGTRQSLYDNEDYQDAAETFYEAELTAIQEPDPDHPGLYDQPYKGVQYMGIPEFQDFGTRASQEFSDVIAGNTSPEQALQESQKIVEEGTSRYREE